jgi:hypothetical protein
MRRSASDAPYTPSTRSISGRTVARWLRGYDYSRKVVVRHSKPLWQPDYVNDDDCRAKLQQSIAAVTAIFREAFRGRRGALLVNAFTAKPAAVRSLRLSQQKKKFGERQSRRRR